MAEYRCDQCGGLPGEPCGDCPPNYHPRNRKAATVADDDLLLIRSLSTAAEEAQAADRSLREEMIEAIRVDRQKFFADSDHEFQTSEVEVTFGWIVDLLLPLQSRSQGPLR